MRKVVLEKAGNQLRVVPTTNAIMGLLRPVLTFTEKVFLRGRPYYRAKEEGRPTMILQDHECFGIDVRQQLGTAFGFHYLITQTLKRAGYVVRVRDIDPHPRPEVYRPVWERLEEFGIELRHRQNEFLVRMLTSPCGRFDCPPGFGKTFVMGVTALLLPQARIDIVTRSKSVLMQRIYPELCQMLPSVGIVCGERKRTGHRVMCYTAGSMHHAPKTADILFGDEVHELASDEASCQIVGWQRSRNYGLSASHERLDAKDLRNEGNFGPILLRIGYQEAVSKKMVVPIVIKWTDVVMDVDPCEDTSDDTAKLRWGIWRNDHRNALIAKDARRYGPDTQVLITCAVLEHAVHLKALLPEFTLVYAKAGMTEQDRRRYINHKLLTPDEPRMTDGRKQQLTGWFEQGKLKKVIATTVWNVGVNFTQLQVLIRADASSSPVNDVQIPGRVSRPDAEIGKVGAIVHDYMDHFNRGFRGKSGRRSRDYARHGWEQEFPGRARRGSLRQQLLFGEQEEGEREPSRKTRRRPPA